MIGEVIVDGLMDEHTLSAGLPVMLPMMDWAAPEAESMYDWRVEVLSSLDILTVVVLCCCFGKMLEMN